ncbi:hypothetical protein [Dactylosporangium sp. NPDC051484]|uniref:hypothetical protein n=1 Tax=Dactylosporangium sp. NPDC051484 TaxID=3154942 RepID=UPI00344F9DDE
MTIQVPTQPTVVIDSTSSAFQFTYQVPRTIDREVLVWFGNVSNGAGGSTNYAARIYSAVGQRLTADTTYTSGSGNSWIAIVATGAPGCQSGDGSFTVHDLTRDGQNAITSIAVTVQNPSCDLHSELRFNSPTPYTAWDVTPKADLGTINVHASTPVNGTVTVTASGSDPTAIGSIGLSNDTSGTFSVIGGTCAPGVALDYGHTCTVRLSAKSVPTVDTYTATLTVVDAAGRSRAIPVSVKGTITSAGNFYPIGPDGGQRILDTRNTSGPLGPGGTLTINPKPGAAALVLNVTVVNASVDDFLTLYPTGASTPNASSINFPKGVVEANSVTVANGPSGVVIFNHAGTVDVIVDLVGYYATGGADDTNSSGGQYFPHAPTRVLDTRTGSKQLGTNQSARVAVDYGAAINPHVRALAVNLTVTNPKSSGFLAVGSNASVTPTSTLNFTPGDTVANFAIISAGPDPDTDARFNLPSIVIANRSSAGIDLIVDVIGYYDDGTTLGGLHYTPTVPTRLLDTRTTQALGAGGQVTVTGPTAKALALNVTGVQPTVNTYLTVWPNGGTRPTASTLNLRPGEIRSNATIAGLGTGNTFNLANFAGTTNAVVDVDGTFDTLSGQTLPPVPAPLPVPTPIN